MYVGQRVLPNLNDPYWANAIRLGLPVTTCPGTIIAQATSGYRVEWDDWRGLSLIFYPENQLSLLETGLDVMLRESFGES